MVWQAMSRLPDHLNPPAIVEQQRQSKFICSACGSGRDCDCNAPALERLAAIKEQKRQAQAKWREKSKENNERVDTTPPPNDPSYDDYPSTKQHEETDDMRPDIDYLPDPEPPLPTDPYAALAEAVTLKNRIVHELMPLMTPAGRQQFLVVLVEEIKAAQ
jgi:hypothetical protein